MRHRRSRHPTVLLGCRNAQRSGSIVLDRPPTQDPLRRRKVTTVDIEVILNRARSKAARAIERANQGLPVESGLAESLAEAFQDLDEWLTKGGFLPVEWRH